MLQFVFKYLDIYFHFRLDIWIIAKSVVLQAATSGHALR